MSGTESPRVTAVLDHLVGALRGRRQVLPESVPTLDIGTGSDVAIRFPGEESTVAARHATLVKQGRDYLLVAEPGYRVEVNNAPVTSCRLAHGDTIRIGEAGPVARFRLCRENRTSYKSVPEACRDCVDCARMGSTTWPGHAASLVRAIPRELLLQTSPWSRGLMLLLVVGLLTTTVVLVHRTSRLEEQLLRQAADVETVAGLLGQAEENALSLDALRDVHNTLASQLGGAVQRLETRLDATGEAGQRLIAEASRGVVFLQGSYGFLDREGGDPLRQMMGPDGHPLTDGLGNPRVSFSGTGPVVEVLFTGTAFVATDAGLMLTNAHVAVPWRFEAEAQRLLEQGLVPVMYRQIVYRPGVEEPMDVEFVLASEAADLAVLRCRGLMGRVPPLALADSPAQPGEEVFVLGYPTGLRAVLARTNEAFVESLMRRDPRPDFWDTARYLAEAGHITPLATRGIVGQVTDDKVVYDADTTHGGSGGPALRINGEVLAVNAAILADFGGSNLGVPAEYARRLLDRAIAQDGVPR